MTSKRAYCCGRCGLRIYVRGFCRDCRSVDPQFCIRNAYPNEPLRAAA